MPNKTPNFKLDYFKQGSYYSSLSDYRRFFTLDYNTESFIGIVGVGILSGWTIEHTSGLSVQILPGNGNINGYFSESPYVVKQRSDMILGDREICVINENNIPEDALTPSQRTIYVSVIQAYNPSYSPVGDIENSYVKVVVPYLVNLSNNTDTYIYAKRPYGAKPYPELNDYPYPQGAGSPPNRNNYTNYDSFKVALDAYNAKLTAIHNYKWYDNADNHFTAVEFIKTYTAIESSDRILLGRVVTRNSTVRTIDTSAVNTIFNIESQIRKYANEYIVGHKHGGNQPYDPPKVRLETDIRNTSLNYFDEDAGKIVYNILEKNETSITLGHKHTFKIDANGNGQTMDQIGSLNAHFHKISNSVVGNPEKTVNAVETHIHTVLSSEQQGETVASFDRYIVYVNNEVFGDETTPYIHFDSSKKQITFDKGVSALNNQYSMEFDISLKDPTTGDAVTRHYSFVSRDVSVFHYMLKAMIDYDATFSDYYTEVVDPETNVSNIGIITDNLSNHPFTIVLSDGSFAGTQDLQNQSSAAQSLLSAEGDIFTFTPNAARNISITLTEVGYTDIVKVEFLGNTEVTGKLKAENILYINANKFLIGEFIPEVIPFVSHIGRLKEECLPLQYSMFSNDGIRYSVVPTITDSTLGHTHKLFVDKTVNGTTTDVLIGNVPVYYASDTVGNDNLVLHYHGVLSNNVSSSDSQGLLNWYNNVSGTNVSSSVHTHNIIYPIIGNNKTIYAIKEDIEGNIFVGTSDGFMIIPSSSAYLFVVNGLELYFYGNDLWTLLGKAREQYEIKTTNPLEVTQEIYGEQITDAEEKLINDGDSVLLTGTPYPNRPTDQIMIKKVSSFKLPDFKYIEEKKDYEVLDTETIIEIIPSNNSSDTQTQTVIVERNFEDTPIWSISTQTTATPGEVYIASTLSTDLFVTGSNLIAKSVGINKSLYQTWDSIDIPFTIGVARKTIKDYAGNYWICSDNGVLVSRSYSSGDIIDVANIPSGNPDIKDIVEGEVGAIYCVSSAGIFKTTNGGKSWSKLFDVINGFSQITRDMSLDKSNSVNGHYHNFDTNIEGDGFLGESIGTGTKHVHVVSKWQVLETMGHTHTMVTTLYAVDNNKIIWKSVTNGINWTEYGSLPDGECGRIFAAFGSVLVSQISGIYKTSNGQSWSLVHNYKAYSYEWSYDMSELMVGCNNTLYGTFDGVTFETIYSFQGNPYSVLLRNGSPQYFEYAYSNSSQTFHFTNLTITSDKLSALVDFDQWYANGGAWDNTDPYDVYVNYKRTYSTKYNEDKRLLLGSYFNVVPSEGKIDFSASTQLSAAVSIYDQSIFVKSSTGFYSGDLISIISNSDIVFATISSVSANEIILDSRITNAISLPASVTRIPNVNGDSSILVNIYNSLLSNIGTLTHDQLEDGLSNYSDGRPYKFNDTYLSNLLQLTQAVRYVYPDINSEFINNLYYDFRYSWSPTDPIYPSIYDYIDVTTSEIYNQKVFDSNFSTSWAKSVNKILIGYGPFVNKILVATDTGLFISNLTSSYEANWKYVNDLPYSVYDLIIFGGDVLLAATANGTYKTTDLITWTLESNPSISYPSYSLGLRWLSQSDVSVSAHTAKFTIDAINNIGTIVSYSGNVYSVFDVNNGIKIENAGDKNGNYVILSISDGGSGFGSKITVSPSFTGADETISNVTMKMATWWGQWNGDENTLNSNITNTLLVGGENHISYNDGGDTWAWREASFTGASGFIPRKFLPLSNGMVLLAATGNKSVQKNYLLKSTDIGSKWSIFKSFEEISGNITKSGLSDFNNTVLNVNYTNDNVYQNGYFDQQDIAIFSNNSSIALFRGKIVWNSKSNNVYQIVVFGNSLYEIIKDISTCFFVIYPSKVNTISETSQNTLLYGTNRGIYHDSNTVVSNLKPKGQIQTVGYNGTITKIDISGEIISIGSNPTTGNTVLFVTADTNIRGKELIGRSLYITDTNPIESYKIVNNTSVAPGEESTIEIQTGSILTSDYIGKKLKIVSGVSRVYIDFDLPVIDNQFNNGKIISASSWSGDYGKEYFISNSSTNYIDLTIPIIPTSTLVNRKDGTESTNNPNTYLIPGSRINALDSTNRLTVWVTFNESIKENALNGLLLSLDNMDSSRTTNDSIIYSNLENSITLNTDNILGYLSGDNFSVIGTIFEQLGGFSHLLTSLESGHYHNVETVNAIVSGKVGSFGFNNASYIDINVTDTTNFNLPIVQLRGDLFNDAQIIFTNDLYVNLRYICEVESHTPTSIRVKVTSASYWDLTSIDTTKISVGWNWQIDATNYGYTDNTLYDDFNVLSFGITTTANIGTDTLKLTSTTGINIGDKIRIQDDTLSYEINYIKQVVDGVTIKVDNLLSRTYFSKRNPQLKVLSNTFANTHTHQIRNNESEVIIISQYLDRGYPAEHSHRILPLMTDVSVLLNRNNSVYVFGSGSIIYRSNDNGLTWQSVVDLNDFIEGLEEVNGISAAIFNNDKIVVGSTSGNLFAEVSEKGNIIPLGGI